MLPSHTGTLLKLRDEGNPDLCHELKQELRRGREITGGEYSIQYRITLCTQAPQSADPEAAVRQGRGWPVGGLQWAQVFGTKEASGDSSGCSAHACSAIQQYAQTAEMIHVISYVFYHIKNQGLHFTAI